MLNYNKYRVNFLGALLVNVYSMFCGDILEFQSFIYFISLHSAYATILLMKAVYPNRTQMRNLQCGSSRNVVGLVLINTPVFNLTVKIGTQSNSIFSSSYNVLFVYVGFAQVHFSLDQKKDSQQLKK